MIWYCFNESLLLHKSKNIADASITYRLLMIFVFSVILVSLPTRSMLKDVI